MHRLHWVSLFLIVIAVCCGSATSSAAELPEGFTSLFDGKSLDGWEGNEKMFRVEDGCIVGGNLKERIPHNEFLCTTKEYENFELRAEGKGRGRRGECWHSVSHQEDSQSP